ncbi:MAG: MlaD family protein [Pseudomonadota bacterium]
MERNAKLAMVTAFLVLTLGVLVVFYRWITPEHPDASLSDINILFRGSVSGLSIGSEVRYLGVPVGRVETISLSQDYPGHVSVVFGSNESLPAPGDLVALLEAQGITGLSIIELRARSSENPGFDVPTNTIPGYPSLFSQLAGSADRITTSVESTLARLDKVLSDETAEDLAVVINHLKTLSTNLAEASGDIDTLMSTASSVSKELESTLPAFRDVAKRLDNEVLPVIASAGGSIEAASGEVTKTLQENRQALGSIINQELPSLMGLSDELAETLSELDSLMGHINDEPGALLYGKKVREVEITLD